MISKDIIKLLGLILAVVFADIIIFSPGFIGIEIGDDALSSALGVTIILASTLALLYGSYIFLFKKPTVVPVKQMKSREDYKEALELFLRIKTLENDIKTALEQMNSLKKKKETLIDVIGQRFEPNEISYQKFSSTIADVEQVFFLNIRSMLSILNVFDEAEFIRITKRKNQLPQGIVQEKTNVYNDYITFVKNSISTNEEILLRLDKLLAEISKLDSIDPGDIEKMACMQGIDALIKQTKYYKQ